MSGIILTVIPPMTYTFTSLQGASVTQFITLAERIDVSQFESGALRVRVHAVTNTQDTISVAVLPDGYTPDDPNPGSGGTMGWDAIPFASVTAVCSVQITTATTAPSLLVAGFSAPFTNLVRIGLACQRGAGAASTTFVRISVDLTLKTGDDATPMLPRLPGAYIGYLPPDLGRGAQARDASRRTAAISSDGSSRNGGQPTLVGAAGSATALSPPKPCGDCG